MGEPKLVREGLLDRLRKILAARGIEMTDAEPEHDGSWAERNGRMYAVESPEEAAARMGAKPLGWVEQLPVRYADANLIHLQPGQEPTGSLRAWWVDPTTVLWLEGRTGAGKTWTAAAFGNAYADRTKCLMVTARDMFARLRAEQVDVPRFGRLLRSVGLLVIDDLGVTTPTEFEMGALWDVMNDRVSRRLLTVVTTNLTTEKVLTQFGERSTGWRTFGTDSTRVRILMVREATWTGR